MNKKFSFKGILLPVITIGLTAGQVSAESLQEAVEKALKTNPEILAAAKQRQVRDKEKRVAKSGYYPSIDLNAGYGREYTSTPGIRAALGNAGSNREGNTLWREEAGITITQMLYDGGLVRNEVARQQARANSAAYSTLDTSEQIALDTTQSYLAVARTRKVLQYSEENLKQHKRIEDQIKLRSDSGVGRKADLDQIRARVALAESNVVAARVNVDDAETTYKKVVGAEAGDSEPVENWKEKLPENVEKALEIAISNNPTLKQANADIEAAKAALRAAESPMRPRFDLEGAASTGEDVDGVDGWENEWELMLRMRYNLFRGGEDQARLEQRAYSVEEAKEIRNLTYRQLEEAIRLAWSAYEATSAQLEHIQAQVEFNILTRDAYAKQFNIGQRTLLDLLNTENELFEAQIEFALAESDKLFAERRIIAAMGQLIETYGLQPPAETKVVAQAD